MELPIPKRNHRLQQLLMVLAFALPWAKRALPTLIGVVVVFAMIRFIKRKKASVPKQPLALIALLILFILLVVGTLYSQHPDEAWNEIGIKLSFFIFPLLALFTPTLERTEVKSIHHAFLAGCFLFMAITVGHAAWVVMQHPDWYYFTYDRLSWYVHPTYAATYQAMGLFILLHASLANDFLADRKWLRLLAIVFVLGFIALLSSKAGYLCALLVIVFAVYKAYQQGVRLGRPLSQAAILIIFFVATILLLPTTSDRVKNAVEEMRVNESEVVSGNSTEVVHTSSTSMRLITWSASWKLLIENPFGTGTGDTQPRLNMLYEQEGEHYASARQFNAHNQFLQTGAEIGWLGLAALLVIMGALWITGSQEPTAQLFVLLCALNFLFESFLEVQAGIVFFSFWVLVYSRGKH